MIRIFKLIILLVISQVAFGQAPSNYTNINGRYRWIAGMFDSTFHIPKGATPSLRTGGSTNAGGLFYNTADSSVYTYTGTQWIKARGSINPQDTTNKYVTQVYKKSGSDSVFYVKGGVHTWAFNDSTGSPGGGGGGKVYYFNGGISMGTFGGFTMYELGDTANTGTAANFTRATTGNIANFITDPGKPGLLQIPAGVWSVDAWLSETGGGANHAEIWIEVEKWDGSNITTIAISPIEQITEGSTPNLYSWSVSIPTTSLTVTDRIIIQFYISNTNGKTVTLYTQNGYVGEVHTTFTTGIGAINGLTAPAQYLVTGTSGTDFNINSATATHTFNLPTASATNRGALSSTDWTTFNNKGSVSSVATNTATGITGGTITTTGTLAIDTLLISTRAWRQKGIDSIRANYVPYTGATTNVDINTRLLSANSFKANGNGVSSGGYLGFQQFNGTTSALSGYTVLSALGQDKLFLSYAQSPTGTRTAILSSSLISTDSSYTYNFPNKGGTFAMTSDVTGAVSGTTNYIPKFTSSSAIGNSVIYESSSNIGIGTITPATPLAIKGSANNTLIEMGNSSTNSAFIQAYDRTASLFRPFINYAEYFAWEAGGSEQMRLTSTGLGIGTSSPAVQLHLYRNSSANVSQIIENAYTNQGNLIQFNQTTSNGTITSYIGHGGDATRNFIINTGGATRVSLDASGNLGLGVTPSAWGSAAKAIQIGSYGSLSSFTNELDISSNSYWNSGYKYTNTNPATLYTQYNGQHQWFNAPSGTAGNGITFTQAMTLNASGRLLLGTTTDDGGSRLQVNGKISAGGASESLNGLSAVNNSAGQATIYSYNYNASGYSIYSAQGINYFANNVGIGTNSPNQKLDINVGSSTNGANGLLNFQWGSGANQNMGIYWQNSSNYSIVRQSDGAGNLRADLYVNSGGNINLLPTNSVGIGTTSPTQGKLVVSGSITNSIMNVAASIGNNNFLNIGDDGTNAALGVGNSGTDMVFLKRLAGVYSEAMRITSAGLVGIGTSSPDATLDVVRGSTGTVATFGIEGLTINPRLRIDVDETNNTVTFNPNYSGATSPSLVFKTQEAERMRITSAGNVGIGSTSPSLWLTVNGTSGLPATSGTTQNGSIRMTSGGDYAMDMGVDNSSGKSWIQVGNKANLSGSFANPLLLNPNGGSVGIGTSSPTQKLTLSGGTFQIAGASTFSDNVEIGRVGGDNNMAFATGGSERMRITSGGDILVGITATFTNARYQSENITGSKAAMALKAQATTGSTLIEFWNPNGQVGAINTSGTATSYVTSSDYRLKQDLKNFNGLNLVDSIKVYDYQWKADSTRSYGVMAHELQSVLPYAVTGVKDGEKMQGVDYSKIVPILIKSIQELKAEIETLKNK